MFISADTGGLLGLCLGFSVISGVEFIYFMTMRAYWHTVRRRAAGKRIANKFMGTLEFGKTKNQDTNANKCIEPNNTSVKHRILHKNRADSVSAPYYIWNDKIYNNEFTRFYTDPYSKPY